MPRGPKTTWVFEAMILSTLLVSEPLTLFVVFIFGKILLIIFGSLAAPEMILSSPVSIALICIKAPIMGVTRSTLSGICTSLPSSPTTIRACKIQTAKIKNAKIFLIFSP